jgi:glycosyltransferase involved in cell wall biosynthesis
VAYALLRWARDTDVVHVQQLLPPAVAAAILAPVLGKPLVVTNHGSGRFGAVGVMRDLPGGERALHWVARSAAAVGVSQEAADELRSAGFQRVDRIPNGIVSPPAAVEPVSVTQSRLGLRPPVIAFHGRLEPEKDLDLLVEAFLDLRRSRFATLLIVGDGSRRAALEARFASAGVTADVRFTGAVSDPWPFLRAANAYLLPSFSEGMSLALLEAMAASLPVAATDVSGNREVLGGGEFGRLVPPARAKAMSTALGALLEDPATARNLGEAARKHVEQCYSADAMCEAYLRLYERLLEPSCKGPAEHAGSGS